MRMMIKSMAFSSLVIIFGCTSSYNLHLGRNLASVNAPEITPNLLETTESIRDYLGAPLLSYSECYGSFKDAFDYLSGLPSDYFEREYSLAEYGVIIERLWHIKQAVRTHSAQWQQQTEVSRECVNNIKNVNRAIRYLEDYSSLLYLAQRGEGITGLNKDDKSPMFSLPFPWTMAKEENFNSRTDLKTGDILMWRSTSSVSAAISRIGDAQNNFSHLSILYIDPQTGERYNIESLIETGLIVDQFDETELHPGVSKLIVYRHQDPEVARRAGEYAYQLARRTMGTRNHLYYDYGFDLEDHQEVFCSEVIHMAFKFATNGQLSLPAFTTKFDMRNRNFLQALGADIPGGFQPGDLDLEKDFELIAEWRNFNHARVNHLMDGILMSMYQWMDDHDYNFRWTLRGNLLGNTLYFARRTPLIGLALQSRLAKNMPRDALKTVIKLDQVSGRMYKDLSKLLYEESPSTIYSHRDLLEKIEEYRKTDLERFREQKRANRRGESYPNPRWHHLFGPKLAY